MIVLFTDFGWQGPYVGQMKAVLAKQAPEHVVIDLMHDAPLFNARASAYLLAALVKPFPQETIFITVVDPGVGSDERRPCVLKADGNWYVGPDNGLFNVIAKQSHEYKIWEINWRPDNLSDAFHGRDLFAPIATQLAAGQLPAMTTTSLAQDVEDWPLDLAEIIYLDSFGNAVTGLHASRVGKDTVLVLKDKKIRYARVFTAAKKGEPFWYVNSNGLVEIAMKQDHAARSLRLEIGTTLQVG